MSPTIDLQVKFPVIDEQLSALHARAFGYPLTGVKPWTQRLERHSLTWVGAFIDEQFVALFIPAGMAAHTPSCSTQPLTRIGSAVASGHGWCER